jgi:hypothetical protein
VESEVSAGIVCALISGNTVSGQLQTVRELIGSLNTSAFSGTDSYDLLDLARDRAVF